MKMQPQHLVVLPWVVWAALWGGLCRTGTSADCPFGRGSQSTAGSQHPRHQKMESEFHNKQKKKQNKNNILWHIYIKNIIYKKNNFFVSAYILLQFKPWSSGLHLDGRWV